MEMYKLNKINWFLTGSGHKSLIVKESLYVEYFLYQYWLEFSVFTSRKFGSKKKGNGISSFNLQIKDFGQVSYKHTGSGHWRLF